MQTLADLRLPASALSTQRPGEFSPHSPLQENIYRRAQESSQLLGVGRRRGRAESRDEERSWSNDGERRGRPGGERQRGGEGWGDRSLGLGSPPKPLSGPCLSQHRGPCATRIAPESSCSCLECSLFSPWSEPCSSINKEKMDEVRDKTQVSRPVSDPIPPSQPCHPCLGRPGSLPRPSASTLAPA